MQTWDATVNFENSELETELGAAALSHIYNIALDLDSPEQVVMTAIVRAATPEIGELYVGDEEFAPLDPDDWCATAFTVDALAKQLRKNL